MRDTSTDKPTQGLDPRLNSQTEWSCTQCGTWLKPEDVVLVHTVENDSAIPQADVDAWVVAAGGKAGSIVDVGVRLVRTVGLCAACADHVPAEGHD